MRWPVLVVALCIGGGARAEWALSLYGGDSLAEDGDLRLTGGGRRLTFHNVDWADRSFESPIYYGARLTHWWEHWGVAVDFTHTKVYSNPDQIVRVSGQRNDRERLGDTLERFDLSHGLNFITLNGLYRWRPTKRWQPYVGAGAGAAVPHVEATVAGQETEEYQLAGPAAQGLVGVGYRLFEHLGAFVEYKLTYADLDADLRGGARVTTQTLTHQFIAGVSVLF